MRRIPHSAYVFLAGLLPAWAAALGLGDVIPKSTLNQPFLAEIPITAATPDELSGLKVTLASPEAFDRYGLPRPAFLGEMRFTVGEGAAGGPAIRVTSVQPVVEPFVTLLVEMQWPQGRLLREYTVLLDPPAFAGTAAAKPAPTPAAAPAMPAPGATEPAAPTAPAREAGPSAPVPSGAYGSAGTSYGPVARNETLWGIANRNRPRAGVDLNQMMLAIFRANPDAFAGNINRLRAGSVLRIPGADELRGLGRGEALAEVQRQNSQWQPGGVPAGAEPRRLRLVPPTESTRAAESAGAAKDLGKGGPAVKDLQTALDDTRRQVAVKDAELAALRAQLAALNQKKQGGIPGETPITAPPVSTSAPEKPAAAASEPAPVPSSAAAPSASLPPPAPATTPPAARAKTAPPPAPVEETGGLIGSLFRSIWLWILLAIGLLGGLYIARRRSLGGEQERWTPRVAPALDEAAARRRSEREDMIVVEERRPSATGAFDRSSPGLPPAAQPETELPLERTISTDAPVNLDQADPIAEADFHMAYGLYDQAADLLTAASAREPTRKDLRLKLLEVCFIWENREQFLKEAREFRKGVPSDADPDWKRIALMGKQLAPQDPLFAGVSTPGVTADDLDLKLPGPSVSGGVDMPLGEESGGLDFDFSTGASGRTGTLDLNLAGETGQTVDLRKARGDEAPTVLASDLEGSISAESPTIEASYGGTPTIETPTLETPMGGGTLETPTIETPAASEGTTRLQGGFKPDDAAGEQTEEIELDELGLDLTGLDDAARDISTGLQESLSSPDGAGDALDLDLSDAASTAEMRRLSGEADSPTMKDRTKKPPRGAPGEDTAEHPQAGSDDSRIMARLEASGTSATLGADLDLGLQQDVTSTGLRVPRGRFPEDATMTEVGTKLDLARAYLDMGDPDGARSILNEVLEEGDPSQREEAQKLLDGIGR